MASIYRRGSTWWIHYYAGGKSVARSLRTTCERVAREKKKHHEALEITGQLRRPSRILIEPVLQSFCEFLTATRTRKSAKNDLSYLRGVFGPRCPALELSVTRQDGSKNRNNGRSRGDPRHNDRLKARHLPVRYLEEVSTERVARFIRQRLIDDGIAPKTANRIREVLHRMFSFAIESHGYICPDTRLRNPVEGVKRVREPAPQITWLSRDDIREQLEALEPFPAVRAMVATYIYAGLRREEATWLTPKDLDLDRRLLRVRAKTVDGLFWQPKTKRNRVVPVSQALLPVLEALPGSRQRTWLFPSPDGKRWDPDNLSRKIRATNKPVGLGWSCLDYRHTFGSHLAQKGESLYKIAELMGNSPEICRRHYAALIPEKMHDVVEFD